MFVSTFNAERLSIVDSSHLLLPTWPCPRWLFRFTVNWKKLRFCTEKTITLIKARFEWIMFLASVLKFRYQSLTLKYNTEPSKPHIHVKNLCLETRVRGYYRYFLWVLINLWKAVDSANGQWIEYFFIPFLLVSPAYFPFPATHHWLMKTGLDNFRHAISRWKKYFHRETVGRSHHLISSLW